MDPPRRKTLPGAPGIALPPSAEDQLLEERLARQQIERELRETRQQKENILRHGDRLQYELRQQQQRSVAPPPSSSGKPHRGVPWWATAIGAVVTAIVSGGGAATVALNQKPTAGPEDIVRLAQESRERDEKILSYLAGARDDQERRDAITLAVLCAVNSGSPARGVVCPVNACEPRTLTPDGKVKAGEPLCKAVEAWPTARRPP